MTALWPRIVRLLEEIALGLLAFLHIPVPDGGGVALHAAAFAVIGFIAVAVAVWLHPRAPERRKRRAAPRRQTRAKPIATRRRHPPGGRRR